ncbi:hypothetical protein ACRWDP_19850, partial [Escherichia coli]
VTLKMPAFEWVHVQLHQQKGMISLSPPTICNSACAAPSAKGDDKFITTDYLQQCRLARTPCVSRTQQGDLFTAGTKFS